MWEVRFPTQLHPISLPALHVSSSISTSLQAIAILLCHFFERYECRLVDESEQLPGGEDMDVRDQELHIGLQQVDYFIESHRVSNSYPLEVNDCTVQLGDPHSHFYVIIVSYSQNRIVRVYPAPCPQSYPLL